MPRRKKKERPDSRQPWTNADRSTFFPSRASADDWIVVSPTIRVPTDTPDAHQHLLLQYLLTPPQTFVNAERYRQHLVKQRLRGGSAGRGRKKLQRARTALAKDVAKYCRDHPQEDPNRRLIARTLLAKHGKWTGLNCDRERAVRNLAQRIKHLLA